jgi:hypothetical protein
MPVEAQKSLAEVLADRGDPMAGARSSWASHLVEVPEDSAVPLAMSGPHPRAVGSYGAELIEWSRTQGATWGRTARWQPPRWWQELAIVRQLEHDDDGELVWRNVIESAPRRVGKSVRLRQSAVWRTAHGDLFRETQLSMLVSKDLMIGKEIHARSWAWAEKHGWVVQRRAGGQEIRAADDEDSDRWILRAPDGAYGYDVCYGQVDEAWDVKPDVITDGIEPALLERVSPQLHLTSTAHVKASSLMRRRLMNALRDVSEDTLLLFWGAHPDADLDDPKTWRASSPHWSPDRERLVAEKYRAAKLGEVEPEVDDPDPLRGWAAQYLNVWPFLLVAGGSKVLPKWGDLAAPVRVGRPVGLGVASDPDGTWLSFGAAIEGDPVHLALLSRLPVSQRRAFVAEVARVSQKYECPVVIDKGGPASFLIPDLENAGVQLEPVGTDRVVQSVADLVQAVAAGEVEHGGYPDLDAAAVAADWRKIGDRRVFARRSGDISALESVTLAHHASISVDSWSGIF